MHKRFRFGLLALVVMIAASLALAPAALAQNTSAGKKNWAQRHPTLTGIGAGVATHHALKVSARNKKLRHQKLNWAERHPTLSALGAGTAVHHIAKKSGQHKR